VLAEPGGFQVQAALQPLAGGLADGAIVVEAGKLGVLGSIEIERTVVSRTASSACGPAWTGAHATT
jgi:hypothetical protein